MTEELVRRGLAVSEEEGAGLVEAGRVTVDGAPALNPARQVAAGEAVTVTPPPARYVSRGGDKLAHGLRALGVDPAGRRCLDAGAATGGFTDCLLQNGAAHVVAVDVGYGLLDHRLRGDPRVTVLERTNVRHLTPDDLPGAPVELVVADLSFTSLAGMLPALRRLAGPRAEALVLVKPQFEAAPDAVPQGGVVRDPEVWRRALRSVLTAAAGVGWGARGLTASPLPGASGNVEFLLRLAAVTRDRGEPPEAGGQPGAGAPSRVGYPPGAPAGVEVTRGRVEVEAALEALEVGAVLEEAAAIAGGDR